LKFIITGADSKTGAVVKRTLEARDAGEAYRLANAAGVYVSDVRPCPTHFRLISRMLHAPWKLPRLAQVAHFADSIGLGDSAKADSVQKSSLHFTASTLLGRFGCRGVCRWRRRLDIRHQPLGNIELEGGQQLRLLGVGSGHPA
jgi:hypothetical protein